MAKRFLIVDGSGLFYRGFYVRSANRLLSDRGEPTGAVHVFGMMLASLRDTYQPDYFAVAFDKSRHTFRTELYPAYKSKRKPMPDDLRAQISLLQSFLEAAGIRFLEKENYEADDIMGTLATRAAAMGLETYIATGDADLLQLVRKGLQVLFISRGVKNMKTYDEATFEEKYGFKPLQLIDYKAFTGDASDNIPGVDGFGEKTTKRLLAQYATVEGVYQNLQTVDLPRESLRKKLEASREQVFLAKNLATIRTEVSLDVAPTDCTFQGNTELLTNFAERYGLHTITKPFLPHDVIELPTPAQTTESETRDKFLAHVQKTKRVAIAAEFLGRTPMRRFETVILCTDGQLLQAHGEEAMQILTPLWQNTSIQKFVFSLKSFCHAGLPWHEKEFTDVFDVALAGYLLDPDAESRDMRGTRKAKEPRGILGLMRHFFPTEAMQESKEGEELFYQAWLLDTFATRLQERLQEEGLQEVYAQVELPLVRVLVAMEAVGIYVDREALRDKALEVQKRIASLEAEIYECAGMSFKINSPKQLGEVLFDTLGIQPPADAKKTKFGYSTNADILESLVSEHPIIAKILSYRLWAKLKSTYLDSIDALISPVTGRLHTSFHQTVTATGRLSSSDPNLQNIPVRTEEGRAIRELFAPGNGYDVLMSADYSQIELRILAHLSQDEAFMQAFQHGEDIHARTASEVFGIPMEEVTPELRRKAKAVNFGIVYGMSDYGLSKGLHIPLEEATGYIQSYFTRYRGVQEFTKKMIATARERGYATTIFGRKRYLPQLRSENFHLRMLAERMAINTSIQGSAADIIKVAMIHAYEALQRAKLKSRILLQVHDELVLEVPNEEKEIVRALLKKEMEGAAQLSVPLTVDIHCGANWGMAK